MRTLVLLFLFSLSLAARAQQKTVAERLGYPKNTKLLIIHADDLGVSHSENEASIQALEKGAVNSGSIMVPCPWFPEIAAYASAHPNADLGLHLTLTAEWDPYKWGPVLHQQAKSLNTQKGFLPASVEELAKMASVQDVEQELRAQVERAKQFGVDPTHFDTHMGGVLANLDFLKTYIKLGHDYKVPVLLNRDIVNMFGAANFNGLLTDKDVMLDKIVMASPAEYAKGMKNFYTGALTSLQPGLTCILLHAAYDNAEMQAVAIGHPDYGAAWRQADFDFFSSADCKKLLKDNAIQLVTWKEIRDKLLR
ncbi:MAG TPA: polysaccharide deacetylase family protein [Chryseolinea sp.]